MTDVEALRAILPQLEKAEGQLEHRLLTRLMYAFEGREFYPETYDNYVYGSCPPIIRTEPSVFDVWYIPRDRCPDCDLTAADALRQELLPDWPFEYGREYMLLQATCRLENPANSDPVFGDHDNICTAILIALTKALIAQAEELETA